MGMNKKPRYGTKKYWQWLGSLGGKASAKKRAKKVKK